MKTTIITIACLLLISACATQYGAMNFTGGVEATKIADDLVQIEAKGNSHTSASRIQQFVLLKAAETAKENGYEGFEIVNSQDNSQTSVTVNNPGIYMGVPSPTFVNANQRPGLIVNVRLIRDAKKAPFKADEIIRNLSPVLQAKSQ